MALQLITWENALEVTNGQFTLDSILMLFTLERRKKAQNDLFPSTGLTWFFKHLWPWECGAEGCRRVQGDERRGLGVRHVFARLWNQSVSAWQWHRTVAIDRLVSWRQACLGFFACACANIRCASTKTGRRDMSNLKESPGGTSLAVQWLRIPLSVQGWELDLWSGN